MDWKAKVQIVKPTIVHLKEHASVLATPDPKAQGRANTLNKISIWSPFKLIITDQGLITLKLFFAYICAVYLANVEGSFRKSCLSIYDFFEEKWF